MFELCHKVMISKTIMATLLLQKIKNVILESQKAAVLIFPLPLYAHLPKKETEMLIQVHYEI